MEITWVISSWLLGSGARTHRLVADDFLSWQMCQLWSLHCPMDTPRPRPRVLYLGNMFGPMVYFWEDPCRVAENLLEVGKRRYLELKTLLSYWMIRYEGLKAHSKFLHQKFWVWVYSIGLRCFTYLKNMYLKLLVCFTTQYIIRCW